MSDASVDNISPEPTLDFIKGLADTFINAAVVSLGDPPDYRSGNVIAYQPVGIEVTEVRSGQGLQVGDRVDLGVPLAGDPLDPSLYTAGAAFAAWVKWNGARWTALLVDIERAGQ
jgi:hypothetical protein